MGRCLRFCCVPLAHIETVGAMSSDLIKSNQSLGRAMQMGPARKREKSEGPLIVALLIGACAALGIFIAASNEPDETVSSPAPTQQVDGIRH